MKTDFVPFIPALTILLSLSAAATSVIQFDRTSFEGHEAHAFGQLVLTCSPPSTNRIVVLLKATGGSAEAADLRYVNRSDANLGDWQTGWPIELLRRNLETVVAIGIKTDGAPEPDETLHFTLSVLSGDAVVGAQSNAVFTIRNGPLSISVDERRTATEGTTLRCRFSREGDTNVTLAVAYSTTDGTARAGVDYVAVAGSVTFAVGQLQAEIQVPTLDNSRVDGNRAFRLNLSAATPGIELRETEAMATIEDNERPVTWDRTFAPRPISASGIAPSSDGKLVVTEYPGPPAYLANGTRIVRWNADGTSDSGFTPAHLAHSQDSPYMQRLVLDTAGRCYVAGRFETVNQQPRSGLARLLPNGALDESFRPPPGLVYLNGSPIYFYGGPVHLAAQADGRILCLSYDGAGGHRFVRLNADGSVDNSFRPAAVTTNAVQVWAVQDNRALVRLEGSGVVTSLGRLLARLTSDGRLDPTFHRAQFLLHDSIGSTIVDLVRLPNDKLLVAGIFTTVDGGPRPNLVRLNADGSVDAGFNPPAEFATEGALSVDSLAVDAKGRVLVVGQFRRFNGRDAGQDEAYFYSRERYFSVLRLREDGTPDDTFAPVGDAAFGQFVPDLLSPDDRWSFAGGHALQVFPQPDGKLLAWGCLNRWLRGEIRPGPHFVARIYDDPPATSVELTATQINAAPGADQATVTVRRLGDTSGPASVHYATRDGSAVAGRDYVAVAGSLSFAPLEVTKTFAVSLLDTDLRRRDREFSVTLSDTTGLGGISGPTARLVLAAPFGFREISGLPSAPRLTIFGSVGSTYLLEYHTPQPVNPTHPWNWGPATAPITLTQEVEAIPADPSWLDAWGWTKSVLFRLRRLEP